MVERKEEVGGNWYLPEVKAITWAPPQASWETGSEHGRREGWWKSSWGRCSSSSLPVPSCPSVPAPQLHIFCTCFSWLSFCSIISDQWSLASDSLSLSALLCSSGCLNYELLLRERERTPGEVVCRPLPVAQSRLRTTPHRHRFPLFVLCFSFSQTTTFLSHLKS